MIPTATSWILALMIIVGIAQILIPTPIFAVIPEVTSPERLGLSFGIFIACLNLGMLVGPAAAGAIMDVAGSYQASYALMAGFAFLIIPSMIILSWRQKPI